MAARLSLLLAASRQGRGTQGKGRMDWRRLEREIEGEVLTGPFDRGRYATAASFDQVVPA